MARKRLIKDRIFSKFSKAAIHSTAMIRTKHRGTVIKRLRLDRLADNTRAFMGSALALTSDTPNCSAENIDKRPSFIDISKVKSANSAGLIKRAKIILKAKFATFAIFADMKMTSAGPKKLRCCVNIVARRDI